MNRETRLNAQEESLAMREGYTLQLEDHIKEFIRVSDKLTERVRTLPNWDEEPDEAWEHFDTIVDSRVELEGLVFRAKRHLARTSKALADL